MGTGLPVASRRRAELRRQTAPERLEHGGANRVIVGRIGVQGSAQLRLGGVERALKLRPRAPRYPPVRRAFEHGLDEPEVVAELVQGGVSSIRWPQEAEAVVVGNKPAPGWAERDTSGARQADAKRVPVQAAIKQAKVARIDITEDAISVEGGKIEGQALDLGNIATQLAGSPLDTAVERSRQGSAVSWHQFEAIGQGEDHQGLRHDALDPAA